MTNNKQNILVTGVSTGIGYAIVEKLIAEGYFVFGSVIKKQDAQRLQEIFGDNFHPLIFDVTDYAAIEKAKMTVTQKLNGNGLSALINNAGILMDGPLKHLKIEDLEQQFSVNVFGLLKITQTFLPFLGGELSSSYKPGIIINVSSILGLISLPFMGAYSASKFAVESLTDTLRRELDIYGIGVVSINPGAVKTPIWDKGEKESVFAGTDYAQFEERNERQIALNKKQGLEPMVIAETVHKIIAKKKLKPNTILMKGKFAFWFLLALPKQLQDQIIGKIRG
jgi:NAD(P)-dependent dehydrogenase (short-subunit alcohol dehydrogenase family)